jgi:D-alanyl-D-alanine carboxypeptidase
MSHPARGPARGAAINRNVLACAALVVAVLAGMPNAAATLPRAVGRAFLDAGIPLSAVAIVVQDERAGLPLFTHNSERSFSAASVMKLVTTFARRPAR